jgi:hypothetical protein
MRKSLLLLLVSSWLQAQTIFETQTIDDNISIGYGLAIGDVDGDRRPDVLLADKKEVVWYRNGDWKKFVLAENLTASDNVCIAARDIDGDGKAEIAVGAQWNPGETSDTAKSGSVHYLVRPSDPTTKWSSLQLHHEPTVLDLIPDGNKELIAVGGKEGVKIFEYRGSKWNLKEWPIRSFGIGEVRQGIYGKQKFIAAIEPMHGNKVTVHTNSERVVLDSTYNQGHALACADVLGNGHHQVIAGWREPDQNGKTGIRIFDPADANWSTWKSSWLDEGGIACEDLVVADLDADGKPEIIAAGRASKNLKIYWNKLK